MPSLPISAPPVPVQAALLTSCCCYFGAPVVVVVVVVASASAAAGTASLRVVVAAEPGGRSHRRRSLTKTSKTAGCSDELVPFCFLSRFRYLLFFSKMGGTKRSRSISLLNPLPKIKMRHQLLFILLCMRRTDESIQPGEGSYRAFLFFGTYVLSIAAQKTDSRKSLARSMINANKKGAKC